MKEKKLAVLIGSGSRLPFIYNFVKDKSSHYQLVVVVSFKRRSEKIPWIRKRGIPAFYHRFVDYKRRSKNRGVYNDDLIKILKKHQVDLVFGVGWDIIWTRSFLNAFPNRVINAHPFPLPDGPAKTIVYQGKIIPVLRGMGALEKAWRMKLPITGASVHFARETVDVGPVIIRKVLPIKKGESLNSLKRRHLYFEGQVLIEALKLLSENRITIVNDRVVRKKKRQVVFPKTNRKRVLVVGSGGREHALIWKLAQSRKINKLFCAPGNSGISNLAENVPIDTTDIRHLCRFAKEKQIDLTIVGPEQPLALGIVDYFKSCNLPIFGPSKAASRLESSKSWSIKFMERHNIPHPEFKIFSKVEKAREYVKKLNGDCVVKADGLALGKGVFVCQTVEQADYALSTLMVNKKFAAAGSKVVIQERLVGKEASVMVFCDGENIAPIVPAQDYKRIFNNDKGPNTGGMGSYAPNPSITPTLFKKICHLMKAAIKGIKEEGYPYTGILYAGLMLVNNNPYFLEFNCRFGDPETQVQLPLLKSDLFEIIESCVNGDLDPAKVIFSKQACACVVLAAKGYPDSYQTGKRINGLNDVVRYKDIIVFHAGTIKDKGKTLTNGGRVLGITSYAKSLKSATNKVYSVINNPISFPGMHFRTDIGL